MVFLCLFASNANGGEILPSPVWDESAARHLLSRTCFGGTPKQAKELASLTLHQAVDLLLADATTAPVPKQREWVRDVWVNSLRRYNDMPREEYLVTFRRASTRNDEELLDLRASWLDRMVRTGNPFRENMTLFWHGHFTSASSKMFAVTQAFEQQNRTWHKNAFGNFRVFLEAATLDPGMLIYLDLEESNKANPNENYARELLELFALGVGNYTETDIREIARSLTGWTLDAPPGTIKPNRPTNPETARSLARDGLFPVFRPEKHDNGQKLFLGKTGNFGVREVMDIVSSHPACGPHISGKLIAYFGVDDPNGSLRGRMAKIYTDTNGEIRPMVRELLCSPEFFATGSRANRVKSPIRLLAGACRDLDLQGQITPAVVQTTVPLGQELFNPPTVKGWANDKEWLTSTTLALRYRLGEVLLEGKPLSGTQPLGRIRGTLIPRDPMEAKQTINRLLALDREKLEAKSKDGIQLQFRPERLVDPDLVGDSSALVDQMLARMLVLKPRDATRNSIIEACKNISPEKRVVLVAQLILASPEYQLE